MFPGCGETDACTTEAVCEMIPKVKPKDDVLQKEPLTEQPEVAHRPIHRTTDDVFGIPLGLPPFGGIENADGGQLAISPNVGRVCRALLDSAACKMPIRKSRAGEMTTTESQIELDLVAKLGDLKYTYRPDIRDRVALEANFREKFEALNRVHLTDSEFQRLLDGVITPDVYNAAQTLRHINSFERDDGTPLNYTLVNLKDWCKNDFEVINQLRINTANSHHRYDVMLLINGVPVVQIELKTLGLSPRRAMQQIVDYKNDPGNGYGKTLLCFIQLFIVSNHTDTWYFANNNARHFSFNADERFLPVYQFAAEDNKKITHLDAFADKFLAKCTLGQMISRYMVLVASEQKLMMMRPYQIYAVQAIVDCIHQHCGNGYIWHTTGSGKTLTSFKASTLLKDNPDIDKCLFVVDRKDLDRQTREEFNRFQEGCVEANTNSPARGARRDFHHHRLRNGTLLPGPSWRDRVLLSAGGRRRLADAQAGNARQSLAWGDGGEHRHPLDGTVAGRRRGGDFHRRSGGLAARTRVTAAFTVNPL